MRNIQITLEHIDKVKDLSKDNGQTQAILFIARLLDDSHINRILTHIDGIEKLEGTLPNGIIQYRELVLKRLYHRNQSRQAYYNDLNFDELFEACEQRIVIIKETNYGKSTSH